MMALGSFRWRVAIILITAILLWQASRMWNAAIAMRGLEEAEETAAPSGQRDEPAQQKVHLAVYYEALCPDSRSFVVKQLMPTYRKLSANLDVEMVPYGKAKTIKTNDGYEFVCQHGQIECQANIIHACTIDAIRDPSKSLDFLACMIENNINPVEIMNTCAVKLNTSVEAESIRRCSGTGKGKELLAKYGQMTNSLVPRVSFIPTITLDGSSDNQVRILKNLLKEVCLHFKVMPKECLS
ncbi:PREDICTED: GILT-like protein C02D5.2 [Dinoponera quadriceps]|uniref:GILT-like protein C02D5.2 n=1 Tax=Dinoponera quadriceps TaxID=609295 RepID=A0A6P3XNI7_DINQU|nr:PREDICTED: GILT-like protein C02D5.2 [Dinoponera quadriceps]